MVSNSYIINKISLYFIIPKKNEPDYCGIALENIIAGENQ